jgi:hypothetical protein
MGVEERFPLKHRLIMTSLSHQIAFFNRLHA